MPAELLCYTMQRYAQSSQFKRTVLEFIAEEMLESWAGRAAQDAAQSDGEVPGGVCRITAGATPVVTSPTDSSMQYLYAQLGLGEADVAERHEIGSGLQRLGERALSSSLLLLASLEQTLAVWLSLMSTYVGRSARRCLS